MLFIIDKSTYTEFFCYSGAASVTLGSNFAGAKMYQTTPSTGYSAYRFSLLNDNNEALYEIQDGGSNNNGAAWGTISKKCLLFNL